MTQVSRLGLDLAKSMFQIHGVNAAEKVSVGQALRPVCGA